MGVQPPRRALIVLFITTTIKQLNLISSSHLKYFRHFFLRHTFDWRFRLCSCVGFRRRWFLSVSCMSPQWSPQYACNWRLKKSSDIVKNPSDIIGQSASSWKSSSPGFLLRVELVFQLLQLRDWQFYRPLFKLFILPHFVKDLALYDCEEGAGGEISSKLYGD